MNINELYLDDKGIGNVKIKLNDQDITAGVMEYNILRTTEDDGYLTINLKMKVIPKYVNIAPKKNSKSSIN